MGEIKMLEEVLDLIDQNRAAEQQRVDEEHRLKLLAELELASQSQHAASASVHSGQSKKPSHDEP